MQLETIVSNLLTTVKGNEMRKLIYQGMLLIEKTQETQQRVLQDNNDTLDTAIKKVDTEISSISKKVDENNVSLQSLIDEINKNDIFQDNDIKAVAKRIDDLFSKDGNPNVYPSQEVYDGRIGWNGEKFPVIGDAIREQTKYAIEHLNYELTNSNIDEIFDGNYVPPTDDSDVPVFKGDCISEEELLAILV